MNDEQRLLELIQADLDGRLDGAEKAELARRLLADPAARRLQGELRQTDTLLRDLPRAQPPDELTSAIRDSLGLSDHDRGGRRVADGGVGFRLAAAVVAGLVVVGLGYGLLSERRDTTDLQGSIAGASRTPAALQAGQGDVVVRLAPSQDGTRVTLEASGGATGDVVLDYDPARISCQSTDGSGALSSPANGQWVLSLPAGTPTVTLVCNGEGPVQLESRSTEAPGGRATIRLPP